MSARVIIELSTNRMVLDRYPVSGTKTVWNFVTPTNWKVGDVIVMRLTLDPYDIVDVTPDGKLLITVAPEPPNGWKHAFYMLQNTRTKDEISVDYDSAEAFGQLEKDYRQEK